MPIEDYFQSLTRISTGLEIILFQGGSAIILNSNHNEFYTK